MQILPKIWILGGDASPLSPPGLTPMLRIKFKWCPWWRFGWPAYALRKPCLEFGWNMLSLKASRTLSKMDDISGVFAGVDDDCGCSWLGLVSLMMFWMVCICSEEALFKIWLKSVEFEGIKNPLKDGWHFWSFCWSWWWLWKFLTGAGVLDFILEHLHMLWGSYV